MDDLTATILLESIVLALQQKPGRRPDGSFRQVLNRAQAAGQAEQQLRVHRRVPSLCYQRNASWLRVLHVAEAAESMPTTAVGSSHLQNIGALS